MTLTSKTKTNKKTKSTMTGHEKDEGKYQSPAPEGPGVPKG